MLDSPWAQRYLERRVKEAIGTATGARVEMRHFQFRPLSMEFVLSGLALHGKEPAGSPAMFSAKTVTARLRLRSIVVRKPLLASLDWDEAEIHIRSGPEGSNNLPDMPPSKPDDSGISIGRVALAKTSVYWNDQQLHLGLDANDLAVLVRRVSRGKYIGSISANQIQIHGYKFAIPKISLTSQAEFSQSGLETQILAWQGAGLSGRGGISVTKWSPLEYRFAFQSDGQLRTLAEILGVPELKQGEGHLQGILSYESGNLSAKGKVSARQLDINAGGNSLKGVSATADFTWNADQLKLENINGDLLDGSVRGSGEIVFKDREPEYQFGGRADRVSLSKLAQVLGAGIGASRIASRVSGTLNANWHGSLRGFTGRYVLNLAPEDMVRAGALSIGGMIEGSARYAPDLVLEIHRAELRSRASAISAQGRLGARESDITLGASVSDFEEWRSFIEPWLGLKEPVPLKLRSAAVFRGVAAGPMRNLAWRGDFAAGSFEYAATRWERLLAGITVTPKDIEISNGRLESGDGELQFNADLPMKNGSLDPDRPLHLDALAEKTRAEGLLAALGADLPLHGSLTGKISLQGKLDNAAGSGQFRLERGSLYGEPFNALSTSIVVDRSVWHLNDIALTKGKALAKGSGEIDIPARQLRVGISGSDFQLGSSGMLQEALEIKPGDLQGQMDFTARAEGWTGSMDVEAAAGIHNIVIKGEPFGDATAHITRRGDQWDYNGRSEGAGGSIRFSGVKPAGAEDRHSLECEFRGLRMDPWIQLLSHRESGPKLTVGGTLKARFSPADWNTAEASALATQVSIEYPTFAVAAEDPVKVRYSDHHITIDRFNLKGPSTNLQVEGTARFGQGGSLAMMAEGKAEATLLGMVDPALQASGTCLLKLRVSGTFSRPAIHGSLNVQNVNAGYGDLPFRVTGLTGEVLLEGDRATLRAIEGTSGGGRVVLNGFVDFGTSPRFNIQAGLTQVRVRYPSVFTSTLDGELRLASSAERGEISGDLVLRQMFPPDNFNWIAHVSQVGSSTAFSRSGIQSPVAPRIRLNIHVKSSPAVRFEARDLRMVGDVDVRLQGTLAEPVEVGHVQILSGEAVFRGNRYQIRRGDISMTNPFRTETSLTLEADTRIQRYNLTVNLSGPFDRLKISYRSDPPLPTSDIVTLLAFGYARQQEDMSTGSTHPAATVGASAVVSQALSTQMSSRIQRLFGVSRIKIDPNAGGVATTGGALITVEQQVAPELTITYITNTGISQYRIIRLEWAVSEDMSIIGERDQGGVFGMEIQFRRRFR